VETISSGLLESGCTAVVSCDHLLKSEPGSAEGESDFFFWMSFGSCEKSRATLAQLVERLIRKLIFD
jgi:hypothetical protein